ncbi:unnamed protein product [Symbiodinium necroappetens]|uniref:HEAT repeat domain-containing protein n=1 Tax=Symbiodinium necroappetens TaxID=1628268 RepID=A0A813CK74_9DINO|nr:unnamed protein product [Symbiodinium necroappetens]
MNLPRAIGAIVFACVSSLATAAQPAAEPGRYELLSGVLSSVVETRPQDLRDPALRALRYLEDQDLKPFFGHLASRREPLYRGHGIFGLAELEDPARVNTHLIAKIESPSEQAALIGEAIRLGYLEGEGIREILNWSSIPPIVEVMLIATLGDEMASDTMKTRLERLSEGESPRVSLFANILLVNTDRSTERTARVIEQLNAMREVERLATLAIVLGLVRDNDLTGTGPLLAALCDAFADDDRVRHDALGTYLIIDPQAAGTRWRKDFTQTDSLSAKVRLMFHALSAADRMDASLFNALKDEGNPLLGALIDAAKARASGNLDTQALLALIDTGHRAAMFWVIDHVEDLPDERAVPVLRHAVDRAVAREDKHAPVTPAFAEAAAGLAGRDADQLVEPLRRSVASRDITAVDGILVALLRASDGVPWDASTEPEWTDDRAEALSIVLHAQFEPGELEDEAHREKLERVALGFGGLPQMFRVQAAWMSLEARGEGRRVTAQLMAGTGSADE